MSEQELRTAIERASVMVDDLCAGSEVWRMRIPAQPDRDPDLVISAGLEAGKKALTLLATERERADRAEAALQVAQAECAVLRSALQLVSEAWHDESVDPGVTDGVFLARMRTAIIPRVAAALSGGAGAAFLREHAAMRTLLSEIRDMAATLSCHHSQPGDEFTYDCRDWGDIVRRLDALSAPAAEPEVQP